MANNLDVNPMRIDTASSTILMTEPIKVKSIRVTNEGVIAAGDAYEIQDVNNNVLWKGDGAGDNFNEEVLLETWWRNQFKVTVLATDLVIYITYE